MIKSYVIDTNILIQAPYACQCFEENRVILPLVVLEELDGLKKAEGEKGANARRAIRFLEKLRRKGDRIEILQSQEWHRRSHDTGRCNCLYRSALLALLRDLCRIRLAIFNL